jgi:hypothetical protein
MNRHSATKRRAAKASRSTGTRKAPSRKAPVRKASARKASARKAHTRPVARKPEPKQDVKKLEQKLEQSQEIKIPGLEFVEVVQVSIAPVRADEVKPSAVETIGSAMRAHKFRVGQTVFYTSSPISRPGASGSYKVVRLLPSDGEDYQYRIKHSGEAFERVAKESQLELEG